MTRQPAEIRATLLRALLGAMFFVFAMTTDAVGSIIPKLIDEFRLTLSQASAFHYATMAAIAGGAIASVTPPTPLPGSVVSPGTGRATALPPPAPSRPSVVPSGTDARTAKERALVVAP